MIKKAKKKKKWKWNLLLLMLMLFIKTIIGQKWRNGNIEAVKFVVVVFNAYIVALVEIEDVTKLKLYLVEFTQVLSASTAAQPTTSTQTTTDKRARERELQTTHDDDDATNWCSPLLSVQAVSGQLPGVCLMGHLCFPSLFSLSLSAAVTHFRGHFWSNLVTFLVMRQSGKRRRQQQLQGRRRNTQCICAAVWRVSGLEPQRMLLLLDCCLKVVLAFTFTFTTQATTPKKSRSPKWV